MIQINYFHKLKKIVVLFCPMKKLLSELADFTEKYRKHITYALFFFSLVLVYQIYQSINSPIKFNEVKNERYLKVIDRLIYFGRIFIINSRRSNKDISIKSFLCFMVEELHIFNRNDDIFRSLLFTNIAWDRVMTSLLG